MGSSRWNKTQARRFETCVKTGTAVGTVAGLGRVAYYNDKWLFWKPFWAGVLNGLVQSGDETPTVTKVILQNAAIPITLDAFTVARVLIAKDSRNELQKELTRVASDVAWMTAVGVGTKVAIDTVDPKASVAEARRGKKRHNKRQ